VLIEWGCYGLVSVPVLEILSRGAEYPLDPVWRQPCLERHDKGEELHSSADGVSMLQPLPSGTRFHHSSAHHPFSRGQFIAGWKTNLFTLSNKTDTDERNFITRLLHTSINEYLTWYVLNTTMFAYCYIICTSILYVLF